MSYSNTTPASFYESLEDMSEAEIRGLSDADLQYALEIASKAEIGTRGLSDFWQTGHNAKALKVMISIEKEMARRKEWYE